MKRLILLLLGGIGGTREAREQHARDADQQLAPVQWDRPSIECNNMLGLQHSPCLGRSGSRSLVMGSPGMQRPARRLQAGAFMRV